MFLLPISSTVLIALATDDSVSVDTSGAKCFITWNSGFSANRNIIRFLTDRRTQVVLFGWLLEESIIQWGMGGQDNWTKSEVRLINKFHNAIYGQRY